MEIFYLEDNHHLNYLALQRYLEGVSHPARASRGANRPSGTTDKKRKEQFLKGQDFKCIDCDFIFKPDEKGRYPTATRDHIIPWRYGSTLRHNSEFVCSPCNQERENNRHYHVLRYFGTIDEPK